jgi:hypothetical protein
MAAQATAGALNASKRIGTKRRSDHGGYSVATLIMCLEWSAMESIKSFKAGRTQIVGETS